MSFEPLAAARDVVKTYGEGPLAATVVKGVTAAVWPGELVLLMGPSGSGKTTLISMLAGLMRPTRGHVTLCGQPVSHLSDADAARVRRSALGFVFQTYNLFPALTALDNVAEVLRMKGTPRAQAHALARAALERVGLGARLAHRPGQLSGGQKQRVAIARAVAGSPALIIGDEVTAALDTASALEVMALLREQVGLGRGVLLVTHDRRLERYADRVVEMEDGVVTACTAGGHARAQSEKGAAA